jgi:dUTPase
MKQKLFNYDIPTVFVDDIEWEKLFTKTLPSKKSANAAGYDVVAVGEPKIFGVREPKTNLWKRIDYIEYRTGIQIGPDGLDINLENEGYTHVLAFPRSSVSEKNLVLANSIGLIDNDYRGEILLRFKYIWQPEDYLITRDKINEKEGSFMLGVVGNMNWEKIYRTGEKICQLVAMPHSDLNFFEVEDLKKTNRGSGGFGSTGK